jgi:hypothetical protein
VAREGSVLSPGDIALGETVKKETMKRTLSNSEVVCTWMEPRPSSDLTAFRSGWSINGWWMWNQSAVCVEDIWKPGLDFRPARERLGWIHEVESRLNQTQIQYYCALMFAFVCKNAQTMNPIEDLLSKNRFPLLHAAADTRLDALAEILRSEVEESLKT